MSASFPGDVYKRQICEYVEWILFPFMDPQNVAATGTGDTMQDMIVCTVGSLLLLIPFWMYYKKGKRSFLMGVFETFFQAYTQKTG